MARRISHHSYLPLPALGQPVEFSFNGQPLIGDETDMVTSALLANGVDLFSRSFKFHRPRSVYDAYGMGPETLLRINGVPNELGDRCWLRSGMVVETQNAWPSVEQDWLALNDWLVPRLPNLFYYKLFHKPRWLWPLAETLIRRVAGIGEINRAAADQAIRYEKRYRFPDVCVVGGGPAGLAATLAAMAAGKQVLLIDDQPQLGGHCRHSLATVRDCQDESLNGMAAWAAIAQLSTQVESLAATPQLEILRRTSVFGVYEDTYLAAQSGNDLFKIRAGSVVLAPGASDRHLVFDHNDRPGIMTARGVERLIACHAVAPGENGIVITCHDGGYHTALMMHGAGIRVQAVVDARLEGEPGEWQQRLQGLGIPVYYGQTIHRAISDRWVTGIEIGSVDGTTRLRSFTCDLVVLAVGLKPQLNLLSAGRQRPQWDSDRQILRVTELPAGLYAAGDVNGSGSFATLYREGWAVGTAAALGQPPPPSRRSAAEHIPALPADIDSGGSHHIICKCMDVTRQEVICSVAEGFDAVETLKRYTSLGMGPCQGKQCYEAVARLAAQDTGVPEAEAVPTTLRPPFSPVSFGVLAGRSPHLQPVQRPPMHPCHLRAGATWLDAGRWQRPHSYQDPQLEALHVRHHLGLIDISTLGKLELSGPDVVAFLEFLLPGKYAKLAPGRTRYSIMVGEDGILFEDGTLSRLDINRYYLTTTTGNQDAINALIQWWLTVEPFDVRYQNLSTAYAAINITGPTARTFLQPLVDVDLDNAAFPYMSCREGHLGGVPVRLFRIGFTGELGYELHFPAEYGESLWDYLLEQGQPYHLRPFGVETQRILRLEKGHLIPGVDTDALTNPYEAGVSFAVKDDKASFVGKAALNAFKQQGLTHALMPYALQSTQDPIPEDGVGAFHQGQLVGRVTSSRRSPILGKGIGLVWLTAPLAMPHQTFTIRLGNGQEVQATVLDQPAYDPPGDRLKA